MTESNVNDRRFWMVVGESENGNFFTVADTFGTNIFSDQKSADIVAEQSLSGYANVFVLEAVSRYSIPAPRVVRQNLHIPPITARGESND